MLKINSLKQVYSSLYRKYQLKEVYNNLFENKKKVPLRHNLKGRNTNVDFFNETQEVSVPGVGTFQLNKFQTALVGLIIEFYFGNKNLVKDTIKYISLKNNLKSIKVVESKDRLDREKAIDFLQYCIEKNILDQDYNLTGEKLTSKKFQIDTSIGYLFELILIRNINNEGYKTNYENFIEKEKNDIRINYILSILNAIYIEEVSHHNYFFIIYKLNETNFDDIFNSIFEIINFNNDRFLDRIVSEELRKNKEEVFFEFQFVGDYKDRGIDIVVKKDNIILSLIDLKCSEFFDVDSLIDKETSDGGENKYNSQTTISTTKSTVQNFIINKHEKGEIKKDFSIGMLRFTHKFNKKTIDIEKIECLWFMHNKDHQQHLYRPSKSSKITQDKSGKHYQGAYKIIADKCMVDDKEGKYAISEIEEDVILDEIPEDNFRIILLRNFTGEYGHGHYIYGKIVTAITDESSEYKERRNKIRRYFVPEDKEKSTYEMCSKKEKENFKQNFFKIKDLIVDKNNEDFISLFDYTIRKIEFTDQNLSEEKLTFTSLEKHKINKISEEIIKITNLYQFRNINVRYTCNFLLELILEKGKTLEEIKKLLTTAIEVRYKKYTEVDKEDFRKFIFSISNVILETGDLKKISCYNYLIIYLQRKDEANYGDKLINNLKEVNYIIYYLYSLELKENYNEIISLPSARYNSLQSNISYLLNLENLTLPDRRNKISCFFKKPVNENLLKTILLSDSFKNLFKNDDDKSIYDYFLERLGINEFEYYNYKFSRDGNLIEVNILNFLIRSIPKNHPFCKIALAIFANKDYKKATGIFRANLKRSYDRNQETYNKFIKEINKLKLNQEQEKRIKYLISFINKNYDSNIENYIKSHKETKGNILKEVYDYLYNK